ncbi:MAG: TonB family protein [Chitinophagaceae bacterium]
MEAGSILSADVLDIIFDERNKEYGAYDLRKNYQRRLTRSLLTMSLIVVLMLITYLLVAAIKPKSNVIVETKDIDLQNVADKKKVEPIQVTPPPKQIEQQKIKTVIFTPPVIVDNPPENERPPEQETLADTKIGTVNQDGRADDGLQGPPVDEAKGVVDVPKKTENDAPFTAVEIESQYPGGLSAWSAFVNRNLVYPQEAIDQEKQGTVIVQFIVDIQGRVSDVQAISGPEELRAAAVSVIKKSGLWTAAIQNGAKVKSYKKQPITFKLEQ